MRYWKRVNQDGNTTTVESYSHSLDVAGAIEILQEEYDEYIASLPLMPPPEPVRDLAAEIDLIKVRLKEEGIL